MKRKDLYQLLEEQYLYFNQKYFIETDPIQVPHSFSKEKDIEIAGFLAASIAWGQRPVIIRNANSLLERMDYAPADFVRNSTEKDLEVFNSFKHRTFQAVDMQFFIRSLQHIYLNHGGLEKAFELGFEQGAKDSLIAFNALFNTVLHLPRSEKHLSNPAKNSAAKRINMYLRWMVRKDKRGVDFGLWNKINSKDIMCPLDVHSGNVARKLGILTRKQNDWKALEEVMFQLKQLDPKDPVKYDFALFGLGVFESFGK